MAVFSSSLPVGRFPANNEESLAGGRHLSYVLVTPARNEEAFIEKTIQSMIAQTVVPKRWVIVSDGSIDRTDEIVKRYAIQYPWMELLRMPERKERHFAAKVRCFAAGFERVRSDHFDVIGNLDADISFEPRYIEFLLDRFARDKDLGVAGTPFIEGSVSYDYKFTSLEHVSGACQLFRRKCFESIGGYVEVKSGGIDWIAVTTARMKGWKTRTFVEQSCYHHRPMGTASRSKLRAAFSLGMQDYCLGGHPLWQVFRGCYQMRRRPYVLGGLLLVAGYASALLRGHPKAVSSQLAKFHRREQMQRLRCVLGRKDVDSV